MLQILYYTNAGRRNWSQNSQRTKSQVSCFRWRCCYL